MDRIGMLDGDASSDIAAGPGVGLGALVVLRDEAEGLALEISG